MEKEILRVKGRIDDGEKCVKVITLKVDPSIILEVGERIEEVSLVAFTGLIEGDYRRLQF